MVNPVKQKKDQLLSMEKSLEILLKKTRKDCETAYRSLAVHSNSLAALSIINKNYRGALQMYQKLLDSEKDMAKHEIYLDHIQKAHTYFNYIDCMESNQLDADESDADAELKIKNLKEDLTECENEYIQGWIDKKFKAEYKMRSKVDEVQKGLKKYQDAYISDILEILTILQDSDRGGELWSKLGTEFKVAEHRDENNNEAAAAAKFSLRLCKKTVRNYDELKVVLRTEYDRLVQSRDAFIEELTMFFDEKTKYKARRNKPTDGITDEMVTNAAECHLRRDLAAFKQVNSTANVLLSKCEVCTSEEALKAYGSCLFNDLAEALKAKASKPKEDREERNESEEEAEDDEAMKDMEKSMPSQSQRQRSDFETAAKIVYSVAKHVRSLEDQADSTKDFLDTYSALKEEFKALNEYWTRSKNQICAYNDFDCGKTRMRLIKPNEVATNKPSCVLLPNEVEGQARRSSQEKSAAEANLKKRLCQFIYLQNLQTTYQLGDGEENQDPCPICQCNLGHEWYVIQCGHLYCKECYTLLLENTQKELQNPYMMMFQGVQRKEQLK
jgi:E3 ubiquitin-protein ligase SHPRH